MKELLRTEQLTKKYGQQNAVDHVSLNLYKGDIYGLVGKNGAGKSTLFKLLMGLTGKSEGLLEIMGATKERDLHAARKNIGFFMNSSFFPYLNAEKNIEYFRKLKGIIDVKETKRVLQMVQLDKVKKPYKAYSMGMKQRLGLANALLGNPDIVILDEPTNGLDPQGIVDFRNMVINLNRNHGITFIISSHILGELSMMATRFGVINQGKLIKEFDQDFLHEATRSGLLIRVSDPEKTCVLLEESLQTNQFRVNDKREILLTELNDHPERIAKTIVDAGIDLYQLTSLEGSLEDYFLKLTGGEEHA